MELSPTALSSCSKPPPPPPPACQLRCVYTKPAPAKTTVGSGSNLSAIVAGHWCSTWCCCEYSPRARCVPAECPLSRARAVPAGPENFHGLRCDDYDECSSAPCKNGATCSESFADPRCAQALAFLNVGVPAACVLCQCPSRSDYIVLSTSVNDYFRKFRCECSGWA